MQKGRKVPLRQLDGPPISVKEEISLFIRIFRQAHHHAHAAIRAMPLDETALARYEEVYIQYGHGEEAAQMLRDAGYSETGIRHILSPVDSPGLLPAQYVYLLKSGEYYKIGSTKNIPNRIKQLQTGSPHPVTLVDFSVCALTKINEQEIHEHFSHCRMHGEWFALRENEVDTIRDWFQNGIPTSQKDGSE
jgi:hypothetical protein